MPNVGQTVVRFTGALVLAAGATMLDHPRLVVTRASDHIATAPVVVAARDIPEGVVIDRSALVVAQWPLGTQPEGAYALLDRVANRVSRVAIYKGEAIVPGRLAPKGRGAGLEGSITPGKRAYSIRVNDAATFAGLIQPSARVDVLVVVDDRKQPGERQAWVVAEDVRVIAIGSVVERRSDSTYSRGAVVTLEVVPEDAELLAIAAAQGQMQIVLRGYDRSASVPRQVGSPSPVR